MTDEKSAAAALEQRKLQAQVRMMRLAENFTKVLPFRTVVGLFTGPTIWLLTTALGPDRAAQYFREIAQDIEDEAGSSHGHA